MTTEANEIVPSPDRLQAEGLVVGGDIDKPAFCLLAGVFTTSDDAFDIISLPLTKIPATIGRSHDSDDPHFFGLGNRKALSRQQAIIYFRDRFGGRLVEDPEDAEKLVYRRPDKKSKGLANKAVLREDTTGDLPNEGFFVIECVGKNRIFVNQQRVDPGEVALLESGSRIRMNAYNLYFLLPTDVVSGKKDLSISDQNPKKRKAPSVAPTLSAETKKIYSGGLGAVAKALEEKPVEELMVEFSDAIKGKSWERRQQMIGSTVLYHAVMDAARSKTLQKKAKENNGMSRSEIMDRIRLTDKYKNWVDQILTKMEFKSYQANTSRALTRAGFVRTGTTGRHVKWILPDLGLSGEDIFATSSTGVEKSSLDDDAEQEENSSVDEHDSESSKDNDEQGEGQEAHEGDIDDEEKDEEEEEELKIMKTEKEQAGDDDDDEMEETMETDANDKVST